MMVPETLSGAGTRRARLGVHGKRAARRAKRLEGALVDHDRSAITALEPMGPREVEMWVAGRGALLVAKIHKIAERVGEENRVGDKDALDVLRLLRTVDTDTMAGRLDQLRASDVTGNVTREAIDLIPVLFGTTASEGVAMPFGQRAMWRTPKWSRNHRLRWSVIFSTPRRE